MVNTAYCLEEFYVVVHYFALILSDSTSAYITHENYLIYTKYIPCTLKDQAVYGAQVNDV